MKILVVEDEAIIRKGILKHVRWEQAGVTEVRAAGNAVEALNACQSYRPDIVMTDIKMPGMDGIELCRRLREDFPMLQIIFLTGYVEKEYLKGAIDLHAVGYIEKPLSPGKIQETIRVAVKNLEKEQCQKEAVLHRILMRMEETDRLLDDGEKSRVFLVHTKRPEDAVRMRGRLSDPGLLRDAELKLGALDFLNPKTMAILLEKENAQASDGEIEQAVQKAVARGWAGDGEKIDGWFMAAGSMGEGGDLREDFRQAQEALRSLSWMGWNTCAFYPKELQEYDPEDGERKLLERFELLLFTKNYAEAIFLVEEFYQKLISGRMSLNHQVYHITNEFQRMVHGVGSDKPAAGKKGKSYEAEKRLAEEAETFKELSGLVCRAIRQECLKGTGEGQKPANHTIDRVISYMQVNYSDPEMSIKTLADYVYLTPTYLSNLFKKQTGVTIGQYLTDLRMEEAKRMLHDPRYKLYQVSELSGYKDANYFAKIFKKKTGITPSEYRGKV